MIYGAKNCHVKIYEHYIIFIGSDHKITYTQPCKVASWSTGLYGKWKWRSRHKYNVLKLPCRTISRAGEFCGLN